MYVDDFYVITYIIFLKLQYYGMCTEILMGGTKMSRIAPNKNRASLFAKRKKIEEELRRKNEKSCALCKKKWGLRLPIIHSMYVYGDRYLLKEQLYCRKQQTYLELSKELSRWRRSP